MTYGRLAQIENMELNDKASISHQRKGRAGWGDTWQRSCSCRHLAKMSQIPGRYWGYFISIVWLLWRRMSSFKNFYSEFLITNCGLQQVRKTLKSNASTSLFILWALISN